MTDLSSRLDALSPEKRQLLERMQAAKRDKSPSTRAHNEQEPLIHTEPYSLLSAGDRSRLPADVEDAYPVSATQMGMLFHMEPTVNTAAPPAYHNVNSFELQFPFDEDLMREAVARVVARHPILRTSFDLVHYSEPLQMIHRHATMPIWVHDLRSLPAPERQRIVHRFIEEENFNLIDLSHAPVLRFHFHRLTDDIVQFTLTEPHAISDGWSTHLTLEEIFQHYDALLRGHPAPDAHPLPVTYRDFVALERRTIAAPDTQAYWEQTLSRFTLHKLPRWPHAFRSRPQLGDHKLYLPIEPNVVEGLTHLARSAAVPFKSVLLAAYIKVLSMLTGQPAGVLGLVFNGRPEVPQGDQIRGLFLNTLPLTFDIPRGSWRELAQWAYQTEAAMLPHRRYPLATLQAKWGRQALFEAVFQYVHFYSVQSLLKSGKVAVLDDNSDHSTTNFPLMVSFMQDPSGDVGLKLIVEYDITEFCKEQGLAIQGYFARVLAAMTANPDGDHDTTSFLSPAEYQQQVVTWNQTQRAATTDHCLHTLVEAQATLTLDATAVVFEGRTVTYRELNQRANRLAHLLRQRGVGPEVMVGVALERSEWMMVALLGVLKAGGAYVPLDPMYPPDRLAYILEDGNVPLLLTENALHAALPPFAGQVVLLDDDAVRQMVLADDGDVKAPETGIVPSNLAYVIYTSGSTGKPKGVRVPHAGVVNFLQTMRDQPGLTANDTLVAVTTYAFDISVLELFLPLSIGARLVIASRPDAMDGGRLMALLARHDATVMQATPTTWRLLLESGWQGGTHFKALCGGEALPRALALALGLRVGSLWNMYGPTETTIWSTTAHLAAEQDVITIGRPIANTRIYILDRTFRPLPVGVPGTLYIGGSGVTRDYHARPALTAERFLPDPFSSTPGARLYSTGDLARYLPDGTIEFLGRLDDQVKIRGFRIELGEIETVLEQHAAIGKAVVVAREDQPGNKRLVAYLELVPEEASSVHDTLVSAITHHLKQHLPDYMVPAAFMVMDTFPLTGSGKVNRRALPAPAMARPDLSATFVPPSTPSEEILADIWRRLLRLDQVGVNDNYFELGGDSILAIQIVARATQSGLRFTPTMLFQNSTIAKLAQVAEFVQTVDAEQGVVTGDAPLLPYQQVLLHQTGAVQAHRAVVLEVQHSLDPTQLGHGIQELLRFHDALRLRFVREADGWRQYYAGSDETTSFQYLDLCGDTSAAQDDTMAHHYTARRDALTPEAGSLVQVVYFALGGGRADQLLIMIHSLVADATSWQLLLGDLQLIISQMMAGGVLALPPKTTSFKRWGERLTRWADSEEAQAQAAYWQKAIAAANVGSSTSTSSPATVTSTLDNATTTALIQEVGAAYNIDLSDALLAALGYVMTQDHQQSSLVVETDGHGRDSLFENVDVSRTVGQFTVRYPLVLALQENAAPDDVLKSTKEQRRQLANGGVGYGLVMGDTTGPVAPIRFRYRGQQSLLLPDGAAFSILQDTDVASDAVDGYQLDLNASLDAGALQLTWQSPDGTWDEAALHTLAEGVESALATFITNAVSQETLAYTPSDFPDADLSQAELEDLIANLSDFEDF